MMKIAFRMGLRMKRWMHKSVNGEDRILHGIADEKMDA